VDAVGGEGGGAGAVNNQVAADIRFKKENVY
jgi:hypothetical protein